MIRIPKQDWPWLTIIASAVAFFTVVSPAILVCKQVIGYNAVVPLLLIIICLLMLRLQRSLDRLL